jgi:SAM-dependent methyltransferase
MTPVAQLGLAQSAEDIMHVEAHEWVERFANNRKLEAIEFGAKDINGSIQPLFPKAKWTGVDIADGPRVDVVADAATYEHPVQADLIVSCEVFEHAPGWRDIINNSFRLLKSGGEAIFTCAGRHRPPHSAVDGSFELKPGEHYANVDENEMIAVMGAVGFIDIQVEYIPVPGDVRAYGRKP